MWRSRKLLIGLKNNKKISHHCKKMGSQVKNMMDNKRKIMNKKKKNPCHIIYKRFNMRINHHSWFVGLLGLISLHEGIHPQTIFC